MSRHRIDLAGRVGGRAVCLSILSTFVVAGLCGAQTEAPDCGEEPTGELYETYGGLAYSQVIDEVSQQRFCEGLRPRLTRPSDYELLGVTVGSWSSDLRDVDIIALRPQAADSVLLRVVDVRTRFNPDRVFPGVGRYPEADYHMEASLASQESLRWRTRKLRSLNFTLDSVAVLARRWDSSLRDTVVVPVELSPFRAGDDGPQASADKQSIRIRLWSSVNGHAWITSADRPDSVMTILPAGVVKELEAEVDITDTRQELLLHVSLDGRSRAIRKIVVPGHGRRRP